VNGTVTPTPTELRNRDYSLTGSNSKMAIERGLANATWYHTPIERKRMKELMKRSDGPALRDTALWIGLMIAFAVAGALTWSSPLSWVFFALYGVLYGSGADSRWHETGHGTAFRTLWMNTVVYQIACFMMIRNPTTWRWSHSRHHTDTVIVGRDPEIITPRPPKLWEMGLNLFGLLDVPKGLAATVRHSIGALTADERNYVPEQETKKVYWVARVWLLIYALVIGTAFATGSILPLMIIGLPRMYGAWHHILTGWVQHLGLADDVTDHRLNTRTVLMNPFSRFVYWNMNYHVEHHMFPMVPYHRLPELHEEIKADCVPPSPGFVPALREVASTLFAQRQDPTIFNDRSACLPQPAHSL
jgi:fatty acid desaturase